LVDFIFHYVTYPAERIHISETTRHIVEEVMRNIDFVLHQAALPSVPRSINDPVSTNEVSVCGTLNLLIAARDAGVRRFIYASSSSVYGNNDILPKREDMPPNPISPYAVSKLTGENYCRIFYSIYGLETVCLRYFNVFGPRQDPASQYSAVIPKFTHIMLNGNRPIIYGNGEQSRDFTYVDNVVQANLLACEAEDIAGELFNVACGKRYSLLDLVGTLNENLNTDIEPIFTKARKGDVLHSMADISKAIELLGYDDLVDFKTGLCKTIGEIKLKSADPIIGAVIR
jgi:UDP-glucose 4-epimerase